MLDSPKSTLSQLPEKQRKQIEFIDEIYNKVVNKPSNKHNKGHEKTKTTLVNEDKENKVPPIIFYSDEEYSDHRTISNKKGNEDMNYNYNSKHMR